MFVVFSIGTVCPQSASLQSWTVVMMVVPWVLLLVGIAVAAGMICWLKSTKKGQCITILMQRHSRQLTVDLADREREQIKESGAVEEKESAYDEVKHCAISLKSNIAYTTVKHNTAL